MRIPGYGIEYNHRERKQGWSVGFYLKDSIE